MFRKLVDFWRGRAKEQPGADATPQDADKLAADTATADNLDLSTQTESVDRAEAAMPGTNEIEIMLHLEPPPADPALDDEPERYGPDRTAECAVTYTATTLFDCLALEAAIPRELRKSFGDPWLYCITPEGETTYLTSADGPATGAALIAGWSLSEPGDVSADDLVSASRRLSEWLASRPEGFSRGELDKAQISASWSRHALSWR